MQGTTHFYLGNHIRVLGNPFIGQHFSKQQNVINRLVGNSRMSATTAQDRAEIAAKLIELMKKSDIMNLDITAEQLLNAVKLIEENKEEPDISSDLTIFTITRLTYMIN